MILQHGEQPEDHLRALAKELKEAKDTQETWLKDFEPMLNLENK